MLNIEDVSILPANLLVPHYLFASYCYYWCNESPMTDEAFDFMCKRLQSEWKTIEHQHKHLVDYDALRAGSCLLGQDKFPLRVQVGWERYLENCLSGRAKVDIHCLYAGRIPTLPTTNTRPVVQPTPVIAGKPKRRRSR